MKPCPYCREEVKDEAVKCRYCGSVLAAGTSAANPALPKVELEPNQVLLVLDRGLLYFAKFVLGIVVVVIALGTAFFGFDLNKAREDLNKAREDVDQMQKDVQKVQRVVQDAQNKVENAQKSVEATAENLRAIGAEAQRRLTEVQQEAGEIHLIRLSVVAASTTGPSSSDPTKFGRSYTALEVAALYHFPTEQHGAGQTVGLIELGGGYRREVAGFVETPFRLR